MQALTVRKSSEKFTKDLIPKTQIILYMGRGRDVIPENKNGLRRLFTFLSFCLKAIL